jgi:hypothetical protein
MSNTPTAAFDFDQLTLGEVATIEDVSGYGIGALDQNKPQGKFLAALLMVAHRRNGEPTYTLNQAMAVPLLDAQAYLGIGTDDDETPAEIDAARAEGDVPSDDAGEPS